jgi:hypothetical protein
MANEEGYSKIATLMSCHGEFAIFRRFSKLNFQNLLYLQAELTHLEADLKEVAVRDQADPNRAIYSKYWWYLAQSEENHDDREQWEKVIQIGEKLKEYSKSRFFSIFESQQPLLRHTNSPYLTPGRFQN